MNFLDLADIYTHIEKKFDKHIVRVQEFLRQPSISAEDRGIRECAELLRQYYTALGCKEAVLVETGGHPGVWAFYDAGAPVTLLNYGMYDVQPVAGQAWTSPPFEAALHRRGDWGRVMLARGAINSKGPLRAWLNALESIIAVRGSLPVNIMFLAEGEEELGSPHLPQIVARYAERLQQATAVFEPNACQNEKGTASIALGFKGNVYFDMICTAEAWQRGSRRAEVHSSLRPGLDNPISRLVEALASMARNNGNEVTIAGLEETIVPWPEDLALISALAKETDYIRALQEKSQVIAWADDLDGDPEKLLRRLFYGNNLNINGISAGYTGDGAKTVIPNHASCKVNVRLVPNQEPEEVVALLRRHLDRHGYSDIQMRAPAATRLERTYTGYTWAKTRRDHPVVQAVREAYAVHGVLTRLIPHSLGSSPRYLFAREPLNLAFIDGGIGHGAREHDADEYLVIDGNAQVGGLAACEKSFVDILFRFAQLMNPEQ